jgi:hypothetical protein
MAQASGVGVVTKPRAAMTPTELEAARAHDRNTRKSRARPGAQQHAKLTAQDREHLALLGALRLWPRWQVGQAYGVSPRTVADCMDRHGMRGRT